MTFTEEIKKLEDKPQLSWDEISDKYIRYARNSHGFLKDFEYKDYHCVIMRHSKYLTYCGYVGIEKNHKFYIPKRMYTHLIDDKCDVHGGITYKQYPNTFCYPFFRDDLFYVGFDCNHSGDICLRDLVEYPERRNHYKEVFHDYTFKTRTYVVAHIKSLVNQLISLQNDL